MPLHELLAILAIGAIGYVALVLIFLGGIWVIARDVEKHKEELALRRAMREERAAARIPMWDDRQATEVRCSARKHRRYEMGGRR